MKGPLRSWIDLLKNAGSLDSDTTDQRLRKAILVFLASIYCVAGLLWGIAYLLLDLTLPGLIPLGYSVISGASLYYFFRSKRFRFFRFVQLLLILLLPFWVQFSLGGFAASSTVMIWSILAPIGALMFAGTGQASIWFLSYFLLLVLSGMLEGRPGAAITPVPPLMNTLFFVMNLGGVSLIFYVLLRYFVREREQTLAVLDQAHRRVTREKERVDKIKSVMANFVPETMKSIIEKNPDDMNTERYVQDATVLFLDIQGFTTLLQSYSTERITRAIEVHFSMFYDIIRKYGGDINETAGDGMMVLFLERAPSKRSENAIRAALEIRDLSLRAPPDPDLFPIQVNIGICSGEVHIGPTKIKGTKGDRWTFTASGAVTVMAARLCDYAEGGQVLVGGATAQMIEKSFHLIPLGQVALKNFKHPVEVYQVTGS